jgi:radical SAM superfamily enzyme YgiQ (UPF0313 family)
MKLLLVAPRDGYFPMGLSYIAAAVKEAGHKVDCCYTDAPEGLAAIVSRGYDFVGTGGMCVHYAQLETVTTAARRAGVKVIVGGNIITSEPELMSRALGVDYAVIGQGEETIVELLRCLERSDDLNSVDGIAYFAAGEFRRTRPRTPRRPLDTLPWPDYEGFGLAGSES